jgi:hypothetical protein
MVAPNRYSDPMSIMGDGNEMMSMNDLSFLPLQVGSHCAHFMTRCGSRTSFKIYLRKTPISVFVSIFCVGSCRERAWT